MRIDPYRSGVSIVLIGAFNPIIFSPLWFKTNGIISESENESAEVELHHRELTIFRLKWLNLLVQQDRFKVDTEQAPYIKLSDFVIQTFREYLSHTPIGVMGINRMVEFSVDSEEIRNKIGQKLAPPEVWGNWGERISKKNERGHGGMRRLIMEQQALTDREFGYIRADVRPSKNKSNGIWMEINDHYQIDNANLIGCERIINILEQNFESSIIRSERIIDEIMKMKDEFRK